MLHTISAVVRQTAEISPVVRHVISPRTVSIGYAKVTRCNQTAATAAAAGTHSNASHSESAVVKKSKGTTNTPFVKNLFLGKFDTNMLVYPEALTKEELEDINSMVDPVLKYVTTGIDRAAVDRAAKFPDEVMQTLKDFGLFGQQIPHEYGGLGFNATCYARMSEVLAVIPALTVTLGAHQSIGLKGILLVGTEEQKRKYLPKLATGEHIAAFCLTEPSSGSDAASIQTTATLSDDGKHFLLNGGKLWISNGGIAEIFTVFARTKVKSQTGEMQDKITAFIVERSFGGVTSGPPEDKMGIRASNTTEVFFDNTPVPVENVLGQVGGGFKVAVNILNSGRFSMGASSAGGLKLVMKDIVNHAVTRKQFGKSLSEFGMIKMMLLIFAKLEARRLVTWQKLKGSSASRPNEKFAKIALDIYAMESMSYMMAGIIDTHTHPDVSLETAAIKVFASEAVWSAASEALQVLGGIGYMKSAPYESFIRDVRILLIFEGTNEILRLYVALMGMQHAGRELKDMVKKMKNPLNNVGFVLKQGFERMQTNRKNPALNMKLYDHVHPTLSQSAEALELRVVRQRYLVEKYLGTFGDKIVDQQLALKRFANVSIDLLAVTASLARASRAKSIGLRNCDNDILMARTFSALAMRRIDANLEELELGQLGNGDLNITEIADTIFKEGGYPVEHPLAKNW